MSRTSILSVKGKYGLKAMIHLAGCEPGVPERVRRIAQQNLISKPFLGELREAGLVASKGLSKAIRSDNGSPFASAGGGGLTRLSVRWAKLGIALERIQPGRPQQNGRHERMHRTLKAEACVPPAADPVQQQARLDAFRQAFNHERPHEALGQLRPADLYVPSPRRFVEPKGDPDYADDQVRRVRSSGEIKWRGGMLFVSEALIGEAVGISERDDGHWLIRFNHVPLGLIDRASGKLARFGPGRPPRPKAQTQLQNLSGIYPVAHTFERSLIRTVQSDPV